MRSPYEEKLSEQTEIQRQICRANGKIVVRKFGAVAKVLWPVKPAAHVAAIAHTSERTAERWLSGEFEPPICIVHAVIKEIFGLNE